MKEEKIFLVFELYLNNKLVGYETHGIDPDIGYVGIYHKTVKDVYYKFGYPITYGDEYYILHDNKKIIADNIIK